MGFIEHTIPKSHAGYRHEGSETVILLAPHTPEDIARPLDVRYVRRVLHETGLLDAHEFDRRLAESYSSYTA